jgi:hypothetical protein
LILIFEINVLGKMHEPKEEANCLPSGIMKDWQQARDHQN